MPSKAAIAFISFAMLGFVATLAILQRTFAPPGHYEVLALVLSESLLLLFYLLALEKLRNWIYRLARHGDYDRALRLNRFWAWFPGYGTTREGLILFDAGRYEDAMQFLRPRAFKRNGTPRFRSMALYWYSLALDGSGRTAEAGALLEKAVLGAPDRNILKVALATCLLSQEKEASVACYLLQQAIAADPGGQYYGAKSDRIKRQARLAWALAACGRRSEAELKIGEALAQSREMRPDDEADVHYFVGEAWRVLGETSKARAEFERAITASVEGNTALNAKKGLAKLDSKSSGFSG